MTFPIIYQIQHCMFCIIIRCCLPLLFFPQNMHSSVFMAFITLIISISTTGETKRRESMFFFIFPFTINQWQVSWLIQYCVNCTLPPSLWTLFYVPTYIIDLLFYLQSKQTILLIKPFHSIFSILFCSPSVTITCFCFFY